MGISLTQLVNTVIDIKNYIDNKINEIDNSTISISSQENNAIVNKEDGIYVDNKTEIIQNLNTKINYINFTQKTTNTKLDSAYCRLEKDYTPVVNAIVPFAKVSGNMFINNGKIIVEPGKRVQINTCLSFYSSSSSQKLVNIKFGIYDITNNKTISSIGTFDDECMYQYNKSLCCQYENTTDTNCEIGLKVIEIYQNDNISAYYSDLTIQEIGRQIIIDPMQYVNETEGIEDTPVGHIISYLGNSIPQHYLLCDGSEYNITDYNYLAQHFLNEYGTINYFGGDGINTFSIPTLENDTNILKCIKYEPTYYTTITKTPSQEEIDLIKEQNNLLKQQISQLETILDSINNEVI